MTSIRVDLSPDEDDQHTYPTITPWGIRELTGSQRRALKGRQLTLEQRVARIEDALAGIGIKLY